MRIGFIGAGKVGFTLGKYFSINGVDVVGYCSKHIDDAKEAAVITNSRYFEQLAELVANSDMLFLTVPDTAIVCVWEQLKALPLEGKLICHCSGLLASTVFTGIERYGAFGYSLHPIYAIHDKYHSFKSFSAVYFTVEGCSKNINKITTLMNNLGNPVSVITAENKALYHAASAMMSNLVVALAKTGSDLFSQCGLSNDFVEKAWHALFLGNAENICRSGVVNALTGPLERGDSQTVRQHINSLEGNPRDIYLCLSQALVEVARKKHPDRDYSFIEAELKK